MCAKRRYRSLPKRPEDLTGSNLNAWPTSPLRVALQCLSSRAARLREAKKMYPSVRLESDSLLSSAHGDLDAAYFKIARRIIPFTVLLFLMAWLDR
jgi:hypothetical protein